MTNTDFVTLESEAKYLNRLKPSRIEVGRRRLARSAKKNGLEDDTREALWVARHMLRRDGNALAAFRLLLQVQVALVEGK